MDENLEKKPVLDENEGNIEPTSAPEENSNLEEEEEEATPAPTPTPELNNTPQPTPDTQEALTDPEPEPLPSDVAQGPAAPEGGAGPMKMFTQEEVNDLMGHVRAETRDRTLKYIYGRYGVEDEGGLDDLVGNAQRYDTLKEESDANAVAWEQEKSNFTSEFEELKEKLALMESGIDKERYEDAKFIIKGKGQPLTVESITAELATHPEWKKQEEKKVYTPEEPAQPQPQIKIPEVPNVLGNENVGSKAPQQSEEDLTMEKYYKIR